MQLPFYLEFYHGNQTIMQELGDNTIQRVDWQNVFPVVLLPRAFRYALGLRVLLLAFLGLVLTVPFLPWYGPAKYDFVSDLGIAFVPNSAQQVYLIESESLVKRMYEPVLTTDGVQIRPVEKQKMLGQPKLAPIFTFDRRYEFQKELVPSKIAHPWSHLTATGYAVFARTNTATIGWFIITLFIWAWLGGAITRTVALRFAQDRRESLSQLFGFMRAKWLSYVGAMILPLAGIFFAWFPVWLLSCIWQFLPAMWGFDLAHLILTLPFALATVLMTIGFILGWPLMFAAISAEGSDAFDAVSRGFSYVYQRPMQFVFYHLCNLVIYAIGIIIAYFVFYQTVTLIGYDPAGLMIIFNSFAFAYFWSSQTVIYFLLRRSCDATPYNQVFLGEIKKRTLPPFGTGKNGEPELKTEGLEVRS